MKTKIFMVWCLLAAFVPATAQQKSEKRGVCWDEKTQQFSDAPVDRMVPGVSWIYTWGEAPRGTAANLDAEGGIDFAPMAWGRDFNENAIRNYVKEHKNIKYLLGFNEPNFSAQANMTPEEAARLWPKLEAIATEYDLRLVSPALNFTGESVGGRVWGIYDWLDEFIRVYKADNGRLPKMDCIALHCYMNWYGANTWFVNEYIYSDIFKNGNDSKYPNIVEVLNAVKETTGQYPRMMLTEFCSWEGNKDGFVTNEDNQIDQMTQRIQKMEQSDLVEGYAWFMANMGGGSAQNPYNSVFVSNRADSELSTLGKVFVGMSGFDTSKYYAPGESVMAKDYVDATTDDQIVRVRPDSEGAGRAPLQIELTQTSSAATYQIEVAQAGDYTFTLHAKTAGSTLRLSVGDTSRELAVAGSGDGWADYSVELPLTAGKASLVVSNASDTPVFLNSLRFVDSASFGGIADVESSSDNVYSVYDLRGAYVGRFHSLSDANIGSGIYIAVSSGGTVSKYVVASPN